MNLYNTVHEKGTFHFFFSKRENNNLKRRNVSFSLKRSILSNDKNGLFKVGGSCAFPYVLNDHLECLPLHIGDDDIRSIFIACMNQVAKVQSLPLNASLLNHPGYPLTIISYNTDLISEDDITELINHVQAGIYLSTEKVEALKSEEDESGDEDDDAIDENVVIEYEEEDELKALMKPIPKNIVLPIEEGVKG